MNIRLVDFDDKHYASNVVQSDMMLKWNALGNTHNLIIRSEYGSNIQFSEKEKVEIEKFSNDQILSGKEIRFSDKYFFTFTQKGYVNNHSISICPATYAVFCCEYDQNSDTCTLFVPNEACLYQCNVVSQIDVHIEREVVKRRIFSFSKTPDKQIYTVHIPTIPGYTDGNLCYTFDGCKYKYPITKAMLGHAFSVPAFNGKSPQIDTTAGNGYRITVR